MSDTIAEKQKSCMSCVYHSEEDGEPVCNVAVPAVAIEPDRSLPWSEVNMEKLASKCDCYEEVPADTCNTVACLCHHDSKPMDISEIERWNSVYGSVVAILSIKMIRSGKGAFNEEAMSSFVMQAIEIADMAEKALELRKKTRWTSETATKDYVDQICKPLDLHFDTESKVEK